MTGFAGVASGKPRPQAATPKAQAVPAVDELTRANSELQAFNQRTNDAAGADSSPALALESADRQLKVVEATTRDRITGGTAQLEKNLARLADVKQKLTWAKSPKGGSKAASSAESSALEQRRSSAFDAAILLEAQFELETHFGLMDEAMQPLGGPLFWVDAVQSDAAGLGLAKQKKNLALVQSVAAKSRASELLGRFSGLDNEARTLLGGHTYPAISQMHFGDSDTEELAATCKRISKDDLAWELVLLESATKSIMDKTTPTSIVPAQGEHWEDNNVVAYRVLHGDLLAAANAIEAATRCNEHSQNPLAPGGAGALLRTSLSYGSAAAAANGTIGQAVADYRMGGQPNVQTQLVGDNRSKRDAFSKHAHAGASALSKYKAALASAKGTRPDSKPLELARAELDNAVTLSSALLAGRKEAREQDTEFATTVAQAEQAVSKATRLAKPGRDASTQMRALLAKQASATTKDETELALRRRSAAVLARMQEVVTRADAALASASSQISTFAKASMVGPSAANAARIAALNTEDSAIASELATAKVQAKEVDTLFNTPPPGKATKCDIRDAKIGNREMPNAPSIGPQGFGSVEQMDYADTDGNGRLEAFARFHGQSNGNMSGDVASVDVFEMSPACIPQHLGGFDLGYQSEATMVHGTYVVDSIELDQVDPSRPGKKVHAEFRVVNGKLKQVK